MIRKRDQDTIQHYLQDVSNVKGGRADEVVIPESIEELSKFLRTASDAGTPVTISGGGTGTTGSRVPFGGSVVSMEKFNKIRSISSQSMSAIVEAGVTVDDLKAGCDERDLFYTSHPTERTAFVGGTIATNASGARSFKYGSIRNYVKRLKMVLATGEVVDVRRGEQRITRAQQFFDIAGGRRINIPLPSYKMPQTKNSAGLYAFDGMDLIDLFIGQEGTLSVIVEAEIGLVPKPAGILSVFVFFPDESMAWSFAQEARELSLRPDKDNSAIDALSIEYFDANALCLLSLKNDQVPKAARASIFFEQETNIDTADQIAQRWLDMIARYNINDEDTWVAMNENEAQRFLSFRHAIPESVNEIVRKSGYQKFSTDISVPRERFRELLEFYSLTFSASKLQHVLFGHIGECHVHTNSLPRSDAELVIAREICAAFVKKGIEFGGTISAEHGVGKTKHSYLELMYGTEGIREMARIKKSLDPSCILGLDNIFPREILREV